MFTALLNSHNREYRVSHLWWLINGLMSVDELSISTGSGMVTCSEAGAGTVAHLVGADPTGWEVGYGRKWKSPTI